MSEAERAAAALIKRYETDQQNRAHEAESAAKVEGIIARVRAASPGGYLTRSQANHFLGVLTGKDYRSAEGSMSPIYHAIYRKLIDTREVAGQTMIDTNTFILWLRNYKSRSTEDPSQVGQEEGVQV